MNFHFAQNKQTNISNKSPLINELAQIQKQIQNKQKLLQKSRLQAEFYQDHLNMPYTIPNKQNNDLADQIMNQLMNNKPNSKKPQLYEIQNPYYLQNPSEKRQNYYNLKSSQNNQVSLKKNNQESLKKNNSSQQSNYKQLKMSQNQKIMGQRQNRFINQRQLQKLKMQQQTENNPFVQQNKIKRSVQNNYSNNKPIINQREEQKKRLQNQPINYSIWENNNRDKKSPEVFNARRQNNFIQPNQRQLQKLKMQYQPNQVIFGNRQRQQKSPNNLIPQNDKAQSHKRALKDNYSNPFLKDQLIIKQKREEQQREYRRVLQQQKKIQQQRRNKQKQQLKKQKYAFNNYDPTQNSYQPIVTTKKVDPNGKRPQIKQTSVQKISNSDLQYMKIKSQQIKDKYKRGRILYDQYLQQITKLADYYKIDYKQLIDKKDLQTRSQEQPWIKDIVRKYNKQNQSKTNEDLKQVQNVDQNGRQKQLYQQQQLKYEIIQKQQSLQKLPESEQSLQGERIYKRPDSYNYYQQQSQLFSNIGYQHLNSANSVNTPQNMQIIQKLLNQMKEMKQIYTKNMQNDKMFLQQTFMKVLANNQHQKQLLTKHFLLSTIQQTQTKSNNQQNNPNQKYKKILEKQFALQSSKDHISDESSQYIDKSLSGIVNKIPMTRQQMQKQSSPNSFKKNKPIPDKSKQLQDFFSKPYKKKKFKNFSIMVDLNQSTLQVPNVSNFLCLKNGKQTINRLFQEDLILMKKMQTGNQIKQLRERANKQYNYNNNSKYAETFNNKPETSLNKQEIIIKTRQNYQEYETYNRQPKNAQIKSVYQHRSYKKIETNQQQQKNSKLFLKKHVSEQSQNQLNQIPTFAQESDIKIRSPVYYSPKLNSQILQQDQYQTSSKHQIITTPTQKVAQLQYKYYQKKQIQAKQSPKKSQPLLNIIKNHDNILGQYQKSPKNEVDIRQYSSINSKDSRNYFSNNSLSPIKNSNNYQQSLQTVRSQQESMRFLKKQQKPIVVHKAPSINYSQTVQSVQESSSRIKPPIQKRKSTSRKKQSSIARTKLQKQSILIKPPSSQNQLNNSSKNISQNYKFDSHVYQSEYDQTYDHQMMKKAQVNQNIKKVREKSPDIHFNPPVIINSASNLNFGNEQKTNIIVQQGKLKSLEEARNMAKQFKRKSANDDSNDYSRLAQQKMSQLESFLTKKDESMIVKKQSKQKDKIRKGKQKKASNTNIMKLLDDLQNQSYKDDFESYRQQSEY